LTAIVPLSVVDPVAVEVLLDDAFGTDRHKRTAYKIRAGMAWLPELSFAATDHEAGLVGVLQSWPVSLCDDTGKAHPLTLVGPVAVNPTAQRTGLGRMMMAALVGAIESGLANTDAMVMIGDPEYYERFFGFGASVTSGWQTPGPVDARRLLARVSRPGGLPGAGMLGPAVASSSTV
jgi:predicted N-acetyltransferase YhbS